MPNAPRPNPMVSAVLALALAMLAPMAMAQTRDLQAVLDRIDRLERDVRTLNQGVFRGTAPTGRPSSGAPESLTPNVAAGLEARLQRLENDFQSLTGRYEEAIYELGQLREQLQRLSEDLELRLGRIEQAQGLGIAASPATALPADAGATAVPPSADPGAASTVEALPTGDAQAQYDHAFGLVRQRDFAGAETALRAFMQAHPDHTLTANAQYWLAETLFARNLYREAAQAFAEGYERFPSSGKAPDNLLKLAISLEAIQRNEDACIALKQLESDYRSAAETIRRRAEQLRNRLRCS